MSGFCLFAYKYKYGYFIAHTIYQWHKYMVNKKKCFSSTKCTYYAVLFVKNCFKKDFLTIKSPFSYLSIYDYISMAWALDGLCI